MIKWLKFRNINEVLSVSSLLLFHLTYLVLKTNLEEQFDWRKCSWGTNCKEC